MNTIHYKRTPDCLEPMAKHEAAKKKDKETRKKDWREDVQLPVKLQQHYQTFSEMLTELDSMWNGHLGRISLSKYRIDIFNNEVKAVLSVLYRARLTARQFSAAEINRMLVKRVIEPVVTR